MREPLKKQLTSAEIRTVGEIHPGNRNEQKEFNNSKHNLAKCNDMWVVQGRQFFIHTCQNGHKQVKLGKKKSYE